MNPQTKTYGVGQKDANITVSLVDLPNIKKQYTRAVKNNKPEFRAYLCSCGLTGTFVTDYAKYLIEFLTNVKNGKSISKEI